jgi:hypothetical protein
MVWIEPLPALDHMLLLTRQPALVGHGLVDQFGQPAHM